MNAPPPDDCVLLPEGVEKLTVKKDEKAPNAIIIDVQREDHTLGKGT